MYAEFCGISSFLKSHKNYGSPAYGPIGMDKIDLIAPKQTCPSRFCNEMIIIDPNLWYKFLTSDLLYVQVRIHKIASKIHHYSLPASLAVGSEWCMSTKFGRSALGEVCSPNES